MLVRRGPISRERRSAAGGELPLRHVPARLRRRVPDLRPFSGRRVRVDQRRARALPLLGRRRARLLPGLRQHALDAWTVLADRVQVSLGSPTGRIVRPDDHVWTSSQLPWLEVVDDRPRLRRSATRCPRAPWTTPMTSRRASAARHAAPSAKVSRAAPADQAPASGAGSPGRLSCREDLARDR